MIREWSSINIARVTVEAETPLSLQAGHGEHNYDTSLVRDCNGLPALPATAIAGVLRHSFEQRRGADATNLLFGYSASAHDENGKERSHQEKGQLSRLQFSWGAVHNSANQPQEGRIMPATLQDDPVLDFLLQSQPLKRERVRLNDRGSADDLGKYDVTAVPAGTRFTFEVSCWGETTDSPEWQMLLQLLNSPDFRLGSNTRSGLGRLKVKAIHRGGWNLRDAAQRKQWQRLSPKLASVDGLQTLKDNRLPAALDSNNPTATLALTAEDYLRIGGGENELHWKDNEAVEKPSRLPKFEDDREADLLPPSEPRVVWSEPGRSAKGSVSAPVPVIPASAVKGALAHRVAFHYNRLAGNFASAGMSAEDRIAWTEQNHAVKALFGHADPAARDHDPAGRAGCLILDDFYLLDKVQVQRLYHNCIDRFTGGVIDGALFSEQVLWQPTFKLELQVTRHSQLDAQTRQALQAALEDLCQGRLPLGAGGSRGLGACTGTLTWSDNGDWLTTEGAA